MRNRDQDEPFSYSESQAGYWRRLTANVLDVIFLVFLVIVAFVISETFSDYNYWKIMDRVRNWFIAAYVASVIFCTALEWSHRRATPGKLLLGLWVTSFRPIDLRFNVTLGDKILSGLSKLGRLLVRNGIKFLVVYVLLRVFLSVSFVLMSLFEDRPWFWFWLFLAAFAIAASLLAQRIGRSLIRLTGFHVLRSPSKRRNQS